MIAAGGLGHATEAISLLQILDAMVVTLVLAVHVYCVYCMKILSSAPPVLSGTGDRLIESD